MKEPIQVVHEFWEQFARTDPLWAILSDPSKRNRQWDLQHFFQTGQDELSPLFYHLELLRIPVAKGRALDFGCGVGRATQALASYFESVVGVDISETMIRLAGKVNRFPGKVRYVHNQADDLSVFPDNGFDFVYSNIVLQHLRPETTFRYLAEFMRVMRSNGLLVFQLPSHQRPQIAATELASTPMADDAYQASLMIREAPQGPVAPETGLTLEIRIRNASGHDWIRRRHGPIRVGNHWLANDGRTRLIQDDGRTLLPEALPASQECSAILFIKTPSQPGDYICEIDLVHEGISWFRDKGAKTVSFPLHVGPKADPLPEAGSFAAGSTPKVHDSPALKPRLSAQEFYSGLSAPSETPGPFPMHGIPCDQISDFFCRRGAEVLRLEEDEHGGPEWAGYRYFVKKI